ncbi:unnamed protein product [Rotaria socialis]|uniref:RING-type domain-containing protein n=1 Tax=Rotaria socialis TaxID=392032 RepID=A0A821FHM7_9BILA|nr:unnamed protein product [Rotaria socialis]CAF4648533.1 unnamed protein product [Rotaria socialis]
MQKNQLKQHRSLDISDIYRKVVIISEKISNTKRAHCSISLEDTGFNNTGNADIVRSVLSSKRANGKSSTSFIPLTSIINNTEESETHESIEKIKENCREYQFTELDTVKEIRNRTFSNWPHRISPSSAQMIEAGFFNCNVGDRVICVYCNIICQQWTPNTDNPVEIHKTLSPKCPYVLAILDRQQLSAIQIMNDQFMRDNWTGAMNADTLRCGDIVNTIACHQNYMEIPRRYASFATCPTENLPSVENLVKAGFFYTGSKNIVTCFYCNGSLQNWGVNDNPTIEHARWFPHCGYAKQLCGAELYRKIQNSKECQKKNDKKTPPSNQYGTNTGSSQSRTLDSTDEITISRLVAARLDLPMSQRLLEQNFKLSIIKRCWEDQLRLKGDDFADDCDLMVACIILQKEIKYIDGKKENIIIPNVAMNKIHERQQTENFSYEQENSEKVLIKSLNNTDVEMSTLSKSAVCDTTGKKPLININKNVHATLNGADGFTQHMEKDSALVYPCNLCLTEEKCLSCIPCGHVATCVPCGHSLRSCPICRSEIKAFVRVYF